MSKPDLPHPLPESVQLPTITFGLATVRRETPPKPVNEDSARVVSIPHAGLVAIVADAISNSGHALHPEVGLQTSEAHEASLLLVFDIPEWLSTHPMQSREAMRAMITEENLSAIRYFLEKDSAASTRHRLPTHYYNYDGIPASTLAMVFIPEHGVIGSKNRRLRSNALVASVGDSSIYVANKRRGLRELFPEHDAMGNTLTLFIGAEPGYFQGRLTPSHIKHLCLKPGMRLYITSDGIDPTVIQAINQQNYLNAQELADMAIALQRETSGIRDDATIVILGVL